MTAPTPATSDPHPPGEAFAVARTLASEAADLNRRKLDTPMWPIVALAAVYALLAIVEALRDGRRPIAIDVKTGTPDRRG